MAGSVFRHPKPMKGRPLIGYAPLPGLPKDDQGRLILDWIYAATGIADVLAAVPPISRVTVAEGKMKVEPIEERDFFK